MKILTIGSAMQDIFILHATPESIKLDTKQGKKCFLILQEGIKIEVQDLAKHIGGGATNSAVSFARLGFETSSFFKTGNDDIAQHIVQTLKKEHVNLSLVCKTKTKDTGTSIIIPCPSGERTTFVYRGANLTLKQNELPNNAIGKTELLYITSLSGPLAPLLISIVKQAKKNTLVACNPGTSQLKGGAQYLQEALADINLFILNGYEAQLLFQEMIRKNEKLKQTITAIQLNKQNKFPELLQPKPMTNGLYFDLKTYFQQILASGPQIAVVTNGADGVYVAHQNTILYYPSLKTKIESTIGAGDAFGSTFTAYIAQKKPIETALFAGMINATSVIEHLDTQTGLLNQTDIQERLKQIDKTKLQKIIL